MEKTLMEHLSGKNCEDGTCTYNVEVLNFNNITYYAKLQFKYSESYSMYVDAKLLFNFSELGIGNSAYGIGEVVLGEKTVSDVNTVGSLKDCFKDHISTLRNILYNALNRYVHTQTFTIRKN